MFLVLVWLLEQGSSTGVVGWDVVRNKSFYRSCWSDQIDKLSKESISRNDKLIASPVAYRMLFFMWSACFKARV